MPKKHNSDTLERRVKKICELYNIKPQRERGQNFLVDPSVVATMIAVSGVKNSDTVLEVGPGLGILTEGLIKLAKRVVSVELDKRLFEILKANFVGVKNLELVNGDILTFNTTDYQLQATSYKIVANLPYQITSRFLRDFLTRVSRPALMTLLLQKEVAERVCAKPGEMSLLSVATQLYGSPTLIGIVGREKFWPSPEVDSAIVKIDNIKSQSAVDNFLDGVSEKFFWRLARIGFAARRKQLKNNLSSGLKITSVDAEKLLKLANLPLEIRAQNLAVSDWIRIAKIVKNHYS